MHLASQNSLLKAMWHHLKQIKKLNQLRFSKESWLGSCIKGNGQNGPTLQFFDLLQMLPHTFQEVILWSYIHFYLSAPYFLILCILAHYFIWFSTIPSPWELIFPSRFRWGNYWDIYVAFFQVSSSVPCHLINHCLSSCPYLIILIIWKISSGFIILVSINFAKLVVSCRSLG